MSERQLTPWPKTGGDEKRLPLGSQFVCSFRNNVGIDDQFDGAASW